MSKGAGPFGTFERSLAWRYLRARREHGGVAMVSAISFIGIALAVTALVVVMSLMNGFREELTDKLLGGRGHVFAEVRDMPQEDALKFADGIRDMDGVVSVTPIIEGSAFAQSQVESRGVLVRGVSGDAARELEFIRERLTDGSAATFGTGETGGDEVMMAASLAFGLGVRGGSPVKLTSSATRATAFGSAPITKTFETSAIFRTGYGELDELYVLMPIEQAQLFFNYRGRYQRLEIRMEQPHKSEELMEAIGLKYPILLTVDWKEQNRSLVQALAIESSMMRIIFLILVTITSLNIITGVVMLVKNKTRDVAILRTMGASQGSVLRIFLMIGAFLGIVGTAVGLAIGLLMVWNIDVVESFLNFVSGQRVFNPEVYGLDGLPARINWVEVGLATGWAVAMSVLVTLAPAWRAARLDPVEALRFE